MLQVEFIRLALSEVYPDEHKCVNRVGAPRSRLGEEREKLSSAAP